MIKLNLNSEILEKVLNKVRYDELQFYPPFLLHPTLGTDYNLQVFCDNKYVNIEVFAKYLHHSFDYNEEEIWNLYHQLISQEDFKIIMKKPEDCYHLLYGVLSKFNKDDIKFFIEDWRLSYKSIETYAVEKYEKYMAWWKNLTGVGYGLYWIASPETRKKIEKLHSQNDLCLINLIY